MSCENHRRTAVKGVLIVLLLAIEGTAAAQLDLTAKGGIKGHATWKITLEPAELAPGGRGEIVASYETVKGWYHYAPSHGASTGLPTSIKVSFKGSGDAGVKLDKKLLYPEPKKKEIKLFDDPETHHTLAGKGTIRQGFVVPSDAPEGKLNISVTLTYMVCSDLLCDPKATEKKALVAMIGAPTAVKTEAAPPEPRAPPAQKKKPAVGIDLGNPFGAPADDPGGSPGHATFDLKISPAAVKPGGTAKLVVRYKMAGSWYIYAPDHTSPSNPPLGRPFSLKIADGQAVGSEGELSFPPSQKKLMGNFGAGPEIHSILKETGEILQAVRIAKDTPPGTQNLKVEISFMACNEKTGLCDAPATNTHSIEFMVSENATGTAGAPEPGTEKTPPAAEKQPRETSEEPPAKKKSLLRIVLGMGIFGLTMATPFVLLALFPGWLKSMPRSGVWMHTVKVFLGFLEIAAALKFFSNADIAYFGGEDFLISRQLFLILWAAIFLASGFYLVGIHRLFRNVSLPRIVSGLVVTALSVYFFTCSIPGAELDWLTTALAPPPQAAPEDSSKPVIVKDDFDEGIRQAKARGDKLTLINFTGFT